MITTRRLTALVAGFLLTALSLASAPTALALPPDPPDGTGDYNTLPQQTVVTRVIHDGTSLWVFVLVAAVAVCLTIAATLAIQALRRARAASTSRIKPA